MWHDGDFDEYNNYGDDDLPSDWFSSQQDAFDEYEDYVMETGHDPYHVFDDYNPTLRERVRAFFMHAKYVIELRRLQIRAFFNGGINDDLPF